MSIGHREQKFVRRQKFDFSDLDFLGIFGPRKKKIIV